MRVLIIQRDISAFLLSSSNQRTVALREDLHGQYKRERFPLSHNNCSNRTHTIVLSAQSHQKHRNNSLTNTSIDRLKAPLLKIFSPSAPESGLNPLVSGSTDQTLPEHWQRVALGTTQILKQKLRNSILSDIGPDPETSLLMPFARYVKAEKSSVPLTVKDDLRRITADRERIVEYLKTQVPPRIKEHRISLVLIIGQQEELLEE